MAYPEESSSNHVEEPLQMKVTLIVMMTLPQSEKQQQTQTLMIK